MDHVIQWLFTDAQTAGAATPSGQPEVFHFYLPWMIFCALGLLIPFYYWVEGRKRFFGSHTLHKAILDKMMNQLALLAFVGPFVMFGRWAMYYTFFSFRIWRYLWLLWGVILIVYWLVYFITKYPREIREYRYQRTMSQYIPQPKQKRKAARAGTR
jgi:hypothetical protein